MVWKDNQFFKCFKSQCWDGILICIYHKDVRSGLFQRLNPRVMAFQATIQGYQPRASIVSYRTRAMFRLYAWCYLFLYERQRCMYMRVFGYAYPACAASRGGDQVGALLYHSHPWSRVSQSNHSEVGSQQTTESLLSPPPTVLGLQSGLWLCLAFYTGAGVHLSPCLWREEPRVTAFWEQPHVYSILLDISMGYKQQSWIDHPPSFGPQSQVLMWPEDQLYEPSLKRVWGCTVGKGFCFCPLWRRHRKPNMIISLYAKVTH